LSNRTIITPSQNDFKNVWVAYIYITFKPYDFGHLYGNFVVMLFILNILHLFEIELLITCGRNI